MVANAFQNITVLAGRPERTTEKSPIPKTPDSLTTVPVPLGKLLVVLHTTPRAEISLQFTEVTEVVSVAPELVMDADNGLVRVGAAGLIPVPETATLALLAPPPPTTMLPLEVTAAIGR